jgi:hypothetical protein
LQDVEDVGISELAQHKLFAEEEIRAALDAYFASLALYANVHQLNV